MMQAFDCIGDLSAKGCQVYHDYSSIFNAGKAGEKTALLGSGTFREKYECRVDRPKLQYYHKVLSMVSTSSGYATRVKSELVDEPPAPASDHEWSEEVAQLVPEVLIGDGWSHDGSEYDASVSGWLQEAVSSGGARVVASGYGQLLEHGHDEAQEALQLQPKEMAACKSGIEAFATSSWKGYDKHRDLGNVIWSPQANSIFVVRGKNSFYSNSPSVTEMRQEHCFMLVRFFRCQASDGQQTVFDYSRKFGDLEILQVTPSASSGDDLRVYRQYSTRKHGSSNKFESSLESPDSAAHENAKWAEAAIRMH